MKKLDRLLRPGMGAYFLVMAAFCAATLVEGNYLLAAAEAAVTLLVFTLYMTNRNRRDRLIQKYLQADEGEAETSHTLEATSKGESPLPAVLVRLGDNGILWAFQRAYRLCRYHDGAAAGRSLTGVLHRVADFRKNGMPPGCNTERSPVPCLRHHYPGRGQPGYDPGCAVFCGSDGALSDP